VDYYALGRDAALRSQPAVAYDYEDEAPVCGAPRTSPAEGYYLAGYLYYGDPNQPKPCLQPMNLAGGCAAPQPSSVELEIDEFDELVPDGGAAGYGMQGYPQYNPGYPVAYPG